MASVYIPVQGTEEEVQVALDQLPHDASDILDILKAEQAPLHLWLIIAREYFKQGKIEQFRQILEEGSGPGQFFFSAFVLFIITPRIFDSALLVLILTVA
jgi:hypothetical protein